MKLKSTLTAVQKHNTEIKQKLEDLNFDENEEDLKNHSKQCDLVIKGKEEELRKIQVELKTINLDSVVLQDQHMKLYQNQGKLQNEAENLNKMIQEKDEFCEKLKELEIIKEFKSDEDCMRDLEELVRVQENELELIKVQNREVDWKLNEELNRISLKSEIIHEKINSTSLNLTKTRTDLNDIENKVII